MRFCLIVPILVLLVTGAGTALGQEGTRAGGAAPAASTTKHPTASTRKHSAASTARTKAVRRRAPRHARRQDETPKAAKTKAAAAKPAETRAAKAGPTMVEAPLPAAAPAEAKAPPPRPEPGDIAGIPAEQKLKIQSALAWAGDFPDARGDEDPLVTAVKNFQKRNKDKVTGTLTEEQRTALLAAANRHRTEFGWSVVVDPATGIRMGLPTKLVPIARDAARGTRWSSEHDEVSIETFRIKDPGLKLADLYEREKKNPGTRKLSRAVLNDNDFFLSGMQGLKYFSVRAKQRDGEIRGFTMLYDQAWEGIVAPVMVALSSAFSPFPERAAPFAALARPVEYGTGLIVSPQGHIVTTSRVADGCQVLVAAGIGNVERVAEDRDHGLTLLRVYGRRKLAALSFRQDMTVGSADPDVTGTTPADLTLVGIPDPREQHGADRPREIRAQLIGDSEIRLRQPVPVAGLSGAAALDARNRFVGMMETRNFVVASAEPTAPPVRLVDAATIRNFMTAHHVLPAAHGGDPRNAVVRMICVRE